VLAALAARAGAQHPLKHPVDAVEIRFARSQSVVSYTLRVDPADLSQFEVAMRVRNVPDTFHVAMAAHPEYDDRYWRHVGACGGLERFNSATLGASGSELARDPAPLIGEAAHEFVHTWT
jgi:hypothetical protein